MLFNIHESSLSHPGLQIRRTCARSAIVICGLKEILRPHRNWTIWRQSPVVALIPWVLLVPLDPAAGLDMPVRLSNQSRPVTNGTNEIAVVDKVEIVRIPCPVVLCVVDFKPAIWWNPIRLYWAEVGANDLS